jgi:hypothetical protein
MFNRRVNVLGATKILSNQTDFTGVDIQTMRASSGSRLVFYLDITSLTGSLVFSITNAASEEQTFLEIHESTYTTPTQIRIPVTELQRFVSISITCTDATYSLSVSAADNSTSEAAEDLLEQIVNNQTSGNQITIAVPSDGVKQSYSASVTGLVAANLATDIFTISGSSSKIVRITRINISATQNTSTTRNVQLIKRSTLNSGGTSTTRAAIPHDSNNIAASATIKAYTVNPTLGTAIGTVRTRRTQIQATMVSSAIDDVLWEFGTRPSQALVLRTVNEMVSINLNGVTLSNNLFDIDIEWTEE